MSNRRRCSKPLGRVPVLHCPVCGSVASVEGDEWRCAACLGVGSVSLLDKLARGLS